jgi:hypothetical protein
MWCQMGTDIRIRMAGRGLLATAALAGLAGLGVAAPAATAAVPGTGFGASLSADGQLEAVAAVSARNAWAVGGNGAGQNLVLHWNGTTWKTVTSAR